MTNRPDRIFRLGAISIAAWNSEKGVSFGSPRNQYKDKEGQWTDAKFWRPADLAALALIARKAAEWALLSPKAAPSAPAQEVARQDDSDDIPF